MGSFARRLRDNSLTLVFLGLFLAALVGQAFVGHAAYNAEQQMQGSETETFGAYVTGPTFLVDVAENWQSEYLQFFLLITLTVWLVQRGSPESKQPSDAGRGSDSEQQVGAHARPDSPHWARVGGLRGQLYSRSLGLVMLVLFVGSWLAQPVTGRLAYNEERESAGLGDLTWGQYVTGPDFWERSLQNWQSEFLAVASMAFLAVFLRERGSPESKPVGAPNAQTGA